MEMETVDAGIAGFCTFDETVCGDGEGFAYCEGDIYREGCGVARETTCTLGCGFVVDLRGTAHVYCEGAEE